MHYVKNFDINGVATKQVACIELHGKPNAATEGAVGVLGIDIDSPLHDVYKCVAVNGSIYTWELLSSGLSIMSATIIGGGVKFVQFPYANLLTPAMYVVKIGDLILDSEGYLYQIKALNTTYCEAEYCGTQIAAYGKSAYDLAVKGGFEGSEEEWIASLKGEQGEQGIQGIQGEPGNTPYVGDNGNWWIAGVDTGVNADKGAQIEQGWYNGTGSGNIISLTFSFVPKLIIIVERLLYTPNGASEYGHYEGIGFILTRTKSYIRIYQDSSGVHTVAQPNAHPSIQASVILEGTTVTLKSYISGTENVFNVKSGYVDEGNVERPYNGAPEDSGYGYTYYAFG